MRQVPRVTRFSDEQVVGFVGHQEFGSVGISEKDGACGFQSRNKRYVLFGDIIFAEKGACGAGPTGNINAALDGKRHAVEGPELRATQHRSFRHMRLLADSLGVQMDKRIQLRFSVSIRLRWSSTISTGETFLDRISCAISVKAP